MAMQPVPEQAGALGGPPQERRPILERLRPAWTTGNLSDRIYAAALVIFGLTLPLLFLGIIYRVAAASWMSIQEFGWRFITSTAWNPAIGDFGALPFIFGTVVSSLLALMIALPLAVGLAIFLTELAPRWIAAPIAFGTELLAAIPSVVYGLWGIFVLVPWLRETVQRPIADRIGGTVPLFEGPVYGVSMLAGGVILSIMIIPFISAVSREVLAAVPRDQREAALALGATRWEMTWQVALPYALPGIVGAAILGLGRALGETMAITMVIGNRPDISWSIFQPAYTMASVLANEFAEASGDLYLSALMQIALILFGITIIVNTFARLLVWRVARGRGR
jgi:phosphate transport system permease protein